MSKQIILLIVFIILVAIIIGGMYYFVSRNMSSLPVVSDTDNKTEVIKEKPSLVPQDFERIKREFPEIIIGTIKFSDQEYISTIMAENGKEYALNPNRPHSMYEYVGIKSGQRVEIQAKFLDENTIEVGSIKPI